MTAFALSLAALVISSFFGPAAVERLWPQRLPPGPSAVAQDLTSKTVVNRLAGSCVFLFFAGGGALIGVSNAVSDIAKLIHH